MDIKQAAIKIAQPDRDWDTLLACTVDGWGVPELGAYDPQVELSCKTPMARTSSGAANQPG